MCFCFLWHEHFHVSVHSCEIGNLASCDSIVFVFDKMYTVYTLQKGCCLIFYVSYSLGKVYNVLVVRHAHGITMELCCLNSNFTCHFSNGLIFVNLSFVQVFSHISLSIRFCPFSITIFRIYFQVPCHHSSHLPTRWDCFGTKAYQMMSLLSLKSKGVTYDMPMLHHESSFDWCYPLF